MTNHVYGGFWRRLYAFSLDWFLIILLTLAVLACGMFFLPNMDMQQSYGVAQGMGKKGYATYFFWLWPFMCMAYFTYFHGICGKTPGKMLFGLRVTRVNGEPLGMGTALLRWFGYSNSFFFFVFGFLWIIFDGKKQGFHDKIAETVVIMDHGDSSAEEE
jgi:uncharacterized RDD family membrane protein YckC